MSPARLALLVDSMPGASDGFAGRVDTRRGTVAALAALAFLVVWLAVWRHDPRRARDLVIEPDAPENLAGVVSLCERGDYTTHVAGSRLPPRYPPFSVMLMPWLAAGLAPERAPAAASRCSRWCSPRVFGAAGSHVWWQIDGAAAALPRWNPTRESPCHR